MNYFISPPEETDLKIDSAQLINRLKAEWPNIDIQPLDNPEQTYSLSFRIPLQNSHLEGSLERTGQCIVLDGDVRDCAKFALWLRSQINRKYQLLFYDEAYSADIELSSETTAHDITKRFMSLEEEPDMTTITLRMPENTLKSLAHIAPVFGFSNYQPLIQHYVDEGLRIDMQRLNNPTIQKLTKSLKHHGVDESLIAKAVEEATHYDAKW
jgi:protease II